MDNVNVLRNELYTVKVNYNKPSTSAGMFWARMTKSFQSPKPNLRVAVSTSWLQPFWCLSKEYNILTWIK